MQISDVPPGLSVYDKRRLVKNGSFFFFFCLANSDKSLITVQPAASPLITHDFSSSPSLPRSVGIQLLVPDLTRARVFELYEDAPIGVSQVGDFLHVTLKSLFFFFAFRANQGLRL